MELEPWIKDPIVLEGETVVLQPFEDAHFAELQQAATAPGIWQFYAYNFAEPAVFRQSFQFAFSERTKGAKYPFVTIHKATQKILGATWFLDIQPANKKLEIGFTWLHQSCWGTEVNLECKLLLLGYAFEQLRAIRVQLKTDENNIRSRKAIEKIGGKFEGILRNDMLRGNGTFRNSAYYSIIESEWLEVKQALAEKYKQRKLQNPYPAVGPEQCT